MRKRKNYSKSFKRKKRVILMKTLLCYILAAVVCFSLSACSNNETAKDIDSASFCVECGNEITTTDKFCGSCGASIDQTNNIETANSNTTNDTTQNKNNGSNSIASTPTTTTKTETSKPSTTTHTHDWRDATCQEKKTCTICGETTGTMLYHNYAPETCTTPKTCTMCGVTSGSASGHDYFNDTCVDCGEKITIPFTVEYTQNMAYRDAPFTIEQFNIIDVDRLSAGGCRIAITTRNHISGHYYYYINFYDANGNVLEQTPCGGNKSAGQSLTTERRIPKNTARIEITRAD